MSTAHFEFKCRRCNVVYSHCATARERATFVLADAMAGRDTGQGIQLTEETEGKSEILFNFHRGSNSVSELRSWLTTSISEIESQVNQILLDCMQLKRESIEYAAATT